MYQLKHNIIYKTMTKRPQKHHKHSLQPQRQSKRPKITKNSTSTPKSHLPPIPGPDQHLNASFHIELKCNVNLISQNYSH